MDPRLQALSEQLLRYRELLAMSYAQKEAIQKGDLDRFASLLEARQALIDTARQTDLVLHEQGELPDDDHGTERRLMAEAAALLEKLVSLDKENERLLEVRVAPAAGARGAAVAGNRTVYPRGGGQKQNTSGILDRSK